MVRSSRMPMGLGFTPMVSAVLSNGNQQHWPNTLPDPTLKVLPNVYGPGNHADHYLTVGRLQCK
jgi:hypothetical protein